MPRLLLAILVLALLMITVSVMLAVRSLAPEPEDGHRVYPKAKVPKAPALPVR